MSNPSNLGAICYEAESAWGEDVTTFATYRVPVRDAVDCSGLTHAKEASGRVEQYRTGGSQHVLMTQGGTFKTKFDWRGHGSTTVGSPTLDALETLLGVIVGNVALSATASQTATGGTASIPTMSAATGFTAGSLCRFGALGDGKGNGQFYAVATHTSSNLTLIGDLTGAPANGNVVYPVAQIYPSSAPTSSAITGLRFLLQTANLMYECHGCFATAISITGLNPGERPTIEVTWQVSWWRYSTATFPSATASDSINPAPIAAGSLNVQAVGTTTRNVRTLARGLTIDITLGVVPLPGYGGVSTYQTIVGATRTDDQVKISWTEDADAATTSPVLPGYGTGTTSYHIEWTGSVTPGSAIGAKFPKVCFDNVPTQVNDGGINRLKIEGMAYVGGTTTSALTLAPYVLGSA